MVCAMPKDGYSTYRRGWLRLLEGLAASAGLQGNLGKPVGFEPAVTAPFGRFLNCAHAKAHVRIWVICLQKI